MVYDNDNRAWAVDLKDGNKHLKTFVEDVEAEVFLDKDRCILRSLQISRLKHNLELYIRTEDQR